jgi:L-fucose isomerase-like protein
MNIRKQTFALYFGNRGFFPGELITAAREELKASVENLGFNTIILDENVTRYGAVETVEEGRKYAAFLEDNSGKYDGIILCLPNFGDENGAIAALEDCGKPILIQAYPDEFGQMDFQHRRDAFCGKFSIMDVFYQYGLPFTIFPPHTIHPKSKEFSAQLLKFAAVCRVANGMKKFTVGALGARTTAFKTVRFDELTLQKYHITTETFDLSEVFSRIKSFNINSDEFEIKKNYLLDYTGWDGVPDEKINIICKSACVIDNMIEEYSLDSIALRCWNEFEAELGIAPCIILSAINDREVAAACELDVANAIPMRALSLASEKASTVLDWNNNYGDDNNKCILFHCGPVAQQLMSAKGRVIDHLMFAKSYGAGCGWGANVGRIASGDMTFCSSKTENGKLIFYLGEGRITDDPIEDSFFGCGGVAEINNLQNKLLTIGKNGYRHHVGMTTGHYDEVIREAFKTYLNYDLIDLDQE